MKIKYTLGDDPTEYEIELDEQQVKRLGLDTISLGPFSVRPDKHE